MQEELRGICDSVDRNCSCNNRSLGRIFNSDNSEILFFIIIFLVLFTSFGNSNR